ncbi:hypothetical protein [Streptomyces axinellae]|uniref:hypothetical protein n=1 Tax=Streptomyces axinellae TaxID=552788 RepID=UPI0031DD2BF3
MPVAVQVGDDRRGSGGGHAVVLGELEVLGCEHLPALGVRPVRGAGQQGDPAGLVDVVGPVLERYGQRQIAVPVTVEVVRPRVRVRRPGALPRAGRLTRAVRDRGVDFLVPGGCGRAQQHRDAEDGINGGRGTDSPPLYASPVARLLLKFHGHYIGSGRRDASADITP